MYQKGCKKANPIHNDMKNIDPIMNVKFSMASEWFFKMANWHRSHFPSHCHSTHNQCNYRWPWKHNYGAQQHGMLPRTINGTCKFPRGKY